jgi:aminopeptidase-like protein
VFDWTVPQEWNISDAWIKNRNGERVVDFRRSNLHVVSYSIPVHATVSRDELEAHLHSLPDRPDSIPYRTSYYSPTWGFCVSEKQRLELTENEYEVCIDSDMRDGHLTYGECVLPGETDTEILVSCHVCHPSLCNDNLSGIAVATELAATLAGMDRRFTYRFLFIPGTIGSITWLSRNEEHVHKIAHGLVLTCVGDGGGYTYKRSRRGDTAVDRAAAYVIEHSGQPSRVVDFYPYGYDERQYCSPGFNLAVGCLMRSQHGTFPEYHTSADNLDFIRPEHLAGSFGVCLSIFDVLEHDRRYVSLNPKCEPQLGKRGLYTAVGGGVGAKSREMALLWVLNLADGEHTLLDVAERSGLDFASVKAAALALVEHNLLAERGDPT